MPTGPKGQRRPADVIGNAIRVAQIATGEVDASPRRPPPNSGARAGPSPTRLRSSCSR
jgi:hypothetical protein